MRGCTVRTGVPEIAILGNYVTRDITGENRSGKRGTRASRDARDVEA
jgi:hypothetical protein